MEQDQHRKATTRLLQEVLCRPASMTALGLGDWDLLVRQAQRANLLARLHVLADRHRVLEAIPPQARRHLESAHIFAEAQRRAVLWEVDRIGQALAGSGVPTLLLKGAAYIVAGLPAGEGRIFNDVDILVPQAQLASVERALFRRGWVTTHLDPYDQRYYREWMHELPPLQHVTRKTVVDVHHTILPPTAALHPDPAKLMAEARPVAGHAGVLTLAPVDMVLHSATHLFFDGELENGLRDLVDLDALLRDFSDGQPQFWPALIARAREMDLTRPLFYALRYTRRILATPIPAAVVAEMEPAAPPGVRFMDALFTRALAPDHPSCDGPLTGLARWCLYLRSHHLRMPAYLLIPHLIRKAVRTAPAEAKPP